jgi:hypothetical protein
MAKRWTCVEVDCDEAITAPDVATAVELVQRHIEEVHSSFELEEMIESVLVDVPESA